MEQIKGFKSLMRSRTMLYFVLAVAALTLQLFLVNKYIVIKFNYNYNTTAFKFYSAAVALADAIILLVVYWLLPQRRKAWTWLLLALLLVYGLVQMLYFPTYHDIMPWSSFAYVQNVDSVLIHSALGEFKVMHLLLFVPMTALLVAWVLWRHRIANERMRCRTRMWMAVMCLVAYLVIHFGMLCCNGGGLIEQKGPLSRRVKTYSQIIATHTRYYLKFGFVAYSTRAAIRTVMDSRDMSSDERQQVETYLADLPKYTDNPFGQQGKNLIFIVVESLNAWAIDLEIDGRPVTPVLNALCADSSSLVALHVKTQVKTGHSSDGHFMYNTGLLPLTTESVAMNYGSCDYPALAKALKGYHCFERICEGGTVWNQFETCSSYGFEKLYDFDDLQPIVEECDWLEDRALFRRGPEHVAKARKPYFMFMVTANMHSPYDKPRMVKTGWISDSKAYTPEVRNYLDVTSVFDEELGIFLDKLKQMGAYDNTIIVIASDHTERVDDNPKGRASISPEGDDCVFIALNTGHGGRIDDIVGQIDVYPTVLDLMGANDYAWKGLGRSMLRHPEGAVAIGPDMVKGQSDTPTINRMKKAWRISELMITRHYFKKK